MRELSYAVHLLVHARSFVTYVISLLSPNDGRAARIEKYYAVANHEEEYAVICIREFYLLLNRRWCRMPAATSIAQLQKKQGK